MGILPISRNENAEMRPDGAKHLSKSLTLEHNPQGNVTIIIRAKFARDILRTSVTVVQPFSAYGPFLFNEVDTTHENNGPSFLWFLFLPFY
jgi:hypothetical protein